MAALWRTEGWATVGEVRRELGDEHPVAYTTAMTVLVRAWRKGRLERRRQGRAFAYKPRQSAEEDEAARMTALLAAFRDRSGALNLFVQALEPDEQEQLRTLLARRRREG